jgi:peptidoglycan-associated lipoprotein
MKKTWRVLVLFAALTVVVTLIGTGCGKKVTPPPAATPSVTEPATPARGPEAAPTLSFSASPTAIEQGQSSTLTWNSTGASEVTIDGGIGTVPASGTRTIRPSSSITYKARATGPGGAAEAEVRITVAPAAVTPPPARRLSDAEFFTENVRDIFFDYDRYDIREDARTILQANARAFAERSSLRVTIEGHCDERGSERYNLALGDRRANAVKEYVVGQGVSAERIDTVSYGKDQPFCTESTEQCWQQNRRAHFVLR